MKRATNCTATLGLTLGLLLGAPAFAANPICAYNDDGSPNTDAVMAALGSAAGDEGFVAAFDLDEDGAISVVDVNLYLNLCLAQ